MGMLDLPTAPEEGDVVRILALPQQGSHMT